MSCNETFWIKALSYQKQWKPNDNGMAFQKFYLKKEKNSYFYTHWVHAWNFKWNKNIII